MTAELGDAPHDSESAVAEYLCGAMPAQFRSRFCDHLLECEPCWQELGAAQKGRRLAESVRVVAPPGLRERIRATVAAESAAAHPAVEQAAAGGRLPTWRLLDRRSLVAAALAMVLGGLLLVLPRPGDRPEPSALVEAVADYRADALPGRQMPAASAPDLSAVQLRAVGAAGGSYGELAVDGYAYRDSAGRRIVVYLSQEPFPTAPGAVALSGTDGPWTARRDDVVLLCARSPHALLVVGRDATLVRETARTLGVT